MSSVVGFAMLGMHLAGVFARAVIPAEKVGDLVMPKLATTVLCWSWCWCRS
jgi:sodium/pantothenate symporter